MEVDMTRVLKPDDNEIDLVNLILDNAPSALDFPSAPIRLSQAVQQLVDFSWWSVTGGAVDPDEPFFQNDLLRKRVKNAASDQDAKITQARLALNRAMVVDGFCDGGVSLAPDVVYNVLRDLLRQ